MGSFTLAAIAGAAFASQILLGESTSRATSQSSDGARPPAASRAVILAMSEVRVTQAQGRVGRGARLPEGAPIGALGGTAVSRENQSSCNSYNAASPLCYAATQQPAPDAAISAIAAKAMSETRPSSATPPIPASSASPSAR